MPSQGFSFIIRIYVDMLVLCVTETALEAPDAPVGMREVASVGHCTIAPLAHLPVLSSSSLT